MTDFPIERVKSWNTRIRGRLMTVYGATLTRARKTAGMGMGINGGLGAWIMWGGDEAGECEIYTLELDRVKYKPS